MAYCPQCDRHFIHPDSLQQHLTHSLAHSRNRAGQQLRKLADDLHQSLTPASTFSQRETRYKEDYAQSGSDPRENYVGIEKKLVATVFSFACRCRASLPSVDEVMRRTKTILEKEVVLALMEAACRLNPPDNSPEGRKVRRQVERQRTERARRGEDALVDHLRRGPYRFIREQEQKENPSNSTCGQHTPDVLLIEPIILYGKPYKWIEYKHYFGFAKNPFIAAKEKRQVKRYLEHLGPGILVYEVGYVRGHLEMDGLRVLHVRDLAKELAIPRH